VDHIWWIRVDAFSDEVQMDQLPDRLDLPDPIQILEAIQGSTKILKDELKKGEENDVKL
jgi:hypothetical protein